MEYKEKYRNCNIYILISQNGDGSKRKGFMV